MTVLMDKLERVTDSKRSRRKSFQVVLARPLVIEVRPDLPRSDFCSVLTPVPVLRPRPRGPHIVSSFECPGFHFLPAGLRRESPSRIGACNLPP